MANIPKLSSSSALHNSARRRLDKKDYQEAEHYILKILRKDINDAAGLALLAELNTAQGKIKDAIVYYMMAIRSDPAEIRYKEMFIELAGAHPVAKYEDLTEAAILECLKTAETLDCTLMQTLWFSHIMSHPEFHGTYGLANRKPFDPANDAFFEGISDFRPLLRPVFLLGLQNLVIENPLFESFVTHIRRHLLEDLGVHQKLTAEEGTMLAAAMSHYSFYTDYILSCTAAEQEKVDALCADIEAERKIDAQSLAVCACYVPLYKLKTAAAVTQRFAASPELSGVIRAQISDYRALCDTAAAIIAVTPVDDVVSVKVKEQYEDFPYPRWKTLSLSGIERAWKSLKRNEQITAGFQGRKIKILIAGCGTGRNAFMFSVIFPDAEILAVDLSRSSLAYAMNKAREYNIKNVTFRQADILRLDALDQTFDLIVSSGVLHHMEDPVQGWKVLCGLLKPDGIMRIGLYSKMARADIINVHDIAKSNGYTPDACSMKSFRQNSATLLEAPVLERLSRFSDYYYLNGYYDLLFHVQEYNYTLLEIEKILTRLELEFIDFANSVHTVDKMDTESILAAWHRFEEKNPAMFTGMYIFWCRKHNPLT